MESASQEVIWGSETSLIDLGFLCAKVNTYPTDRGLTAIGTGGDDFVHAMIVAVESVIERQISETILFLGDGSEDGKVPSGSLLMISHKDKEIMNALDGAGAPASDEEVRQEVAAMSKTSIFRPGIDVTQVVLFPQLTWRIQEKTEMVGQEEYQEQ